MEMTKVEMVEKIVEYEKELRLELKKLKMLLELRVKNLRFAEQGGPQYIS